MGRSADLVVGRLATATRATTYDDQFPHPLIQRVDALLLDLPWVKEARSRVRDEGHVFHVESFVVPTGGRDPSMDDLEQARAAIVALDWKLRDVVVVPVPQLRAEQLPALEEKG